MSLGKALNHEEHKEKAMSHRVSTNALAVAHYSNLIGAIAEFIAGMARVDGRFVIILDIARVLSIDEMAAIRSVDTAPAP